jgi:hypothetical protein
VVTCKCSGLQHGIRISCVHTPVMMTQAWQTTLQLLKHTAIASSGSRCTKLDWHVGTATGDRADCVRFWPNVAGFEQGTSRQLVTMGHSLLLAPGVSICNANIVLHVLGPKKNICTLKRSAGYNWWVWLGSHWLRSHDMTSMFTLPMHSHALLQQPVLS